MVITPRFIKMEIRKQRVYLKLEQKMNFGLSILKMVRLKVKYNILMIVKTEFGRNIM